MNFYRLSGGQFVEERGQPDLLGLLQQIGAVHSRGVDADDQVAFARLGIRDFPDLQDLGAAGLLHHDGAHARLYI